MNKIGYIKIFVKHHFLYDIYLQVNLNQCDPGDVEFRCYFQLVQRKMEAKVLAGMRPSDSVRCVGPFSAFRKRCLFRV